MADQIAPVAVRLGGTFATLADSEARHRALLIEAEQLCAKSESMLASERQEVARLNCELEKASEGGEDEEGAEAAVDPKLVIYTAQPELLVSYGEQLFALLVQVFHK